MKTIFKTILIFLLALPALVFAQNPQLKSITGVNYTKSLDNAFMSGGYCCGVCTSHICETTNAQDGTLDVLVNNTSLPREVLWLFMGNCWTDKMIFDQANRYIEFRVKTDAAKLIPMSVNTWGTCAECCTEVKTWPGNTFTIPKANKWTVVLLKVPPTTGGSQNIIDTISTGLAWDLENGHYIFDYIKIGTAAIPPIPHIDKVNDQTVQDDAGEQCIKIYNIYIPDRIDGLKISVSCLKGNVVKDVSIADIGEPAIGPPYYCLQYTPVAGMGGQSDSIVILAQDTIRHTESRMAFKVSLLSESLLVNDNNVSLFPNPTTGIVNLTGDNIIKTEVLDIYSRSQGLYYGKQIDLSGLPAGTYILNVYGKEGLIKKEKIILAK